MLHLLEARVPVAVTAVVPRTRLGVAPGLLHAVTHTGALPAHHDSSTTCNCLIYAWAAQRHSMMCLAATQRNPVVRTQYRCPAEVTSNFPGRSVHRCDGQRSRPAPGGRA
jgi:hypothetical protein